MSNNTQLNDFIKERKYLLWYVNDYDRLGAEAIVEATLNYGDWDDVQTLIKTMGVKKVAEIFRAQSQPSAVGRQNYFPEVRHYFQLYFDRYA